MNSESQFTAIGGQRPDYGLLNDEVLKQWQRLSDFLAKNWNSGDKHRLSKMNGCLDKLSVCMMQISRLRQHYEVLLKKGKEFSNSGNNSFAVRGQEACADFESMLLHCRAALDCLTWFVAGEFKQPTHSYRKLKNILQRSVSTRNIAALEICKVLEKAESWTEGLLAAKEGAFRDLVAHKEAAIQRTRICFQVMYLPESKILLLDCELGDFPVFRTSSEAAQKLPFIILNVLSLLNGLPSLSEECYTTNLKFQSAILSEYELDKNANTTTSHFLENVVSRMTPDGFELTNKFVDPRILEKAIEMNVG